MPYPPDSRLRRAVTEIQVAVPEKRLQLTLDADQAHYAPRQQATFTITVTDAAGEPVAAELSLALVDEAIFALADDRAGSIFDAFYRPRPNDVRTFDAMALQRQLGPGHGGGGGGMGGMLGATVSLPVSQLAADNNQLRPAISSL